MGIKIGINGLGRIGRMALKIAANHPKLEVVAVNDPQDMAVMAHLLNYDSIHGRPD